MTGVLCMLQLLLQYQFLPSAAHIPPSAYLRLTRDGRAARSSLLRHVHSLLAGGLPSARCSLPGELLAAPRQLIQFNDLQGPETGISGPQGQQAPLQPSVSSTT